MFFQELPYVPSIHPTIHPFAGCATEAREIYGHQNRGVGDGQEDEMGAGNGSVDRQSSLGGWHLNELNFELFE